MKTKAKKSNIKTLAKKAVVKKTVAKKPASKKAKIVKALKDSLPKIEMPKLLTWEEARRKGNRFLPISSEGYHQHSNGGGWVKDTASVDKSSYVAPGALVLGTARVTEQCKILDEAIIEGEANVYYRCVVSGEAVVYGKSHVQESKVSDSAVVTGNAKLTECTVGGRCKIVGDCHVGRGMVVVNRNPTYIRGLYWGVIIVDNGMKIGCQFHSAEAWRSFSDIQIDNMSSYGVTFWKLHKDALLTLCDIHQQAKMPV